MLKTLPQEELASPVVLDPKQDHMSFEFPRPMAKPEIFTGNYHPKTKISPEKLTVGSDDSFQLQGRTFFHFQGW